MDWSKVWVWLKAAGMRAIRTMAQTAVATIGTTAVTLGEVEWLMVASSAALSGVLSLLMSVAGLPEVNTKVDAQVDAQKE